MPWRRSLIVSLGMMAFFGFAPAQNVGLTNAFPNLSFNHPLFLTHSGDGSNRIFVVQQDGLIRVFPNDSSVVAADTFLNIGGKLSAASGEEGLLGLAFPPDSGPGRDFFVSYTTPSASAPSGVKSVIARYSVSPFDSNRGDPATESILLEVDQPFHNHNGGMIAFGPDSCLYLGLGDGGSANDPQNNAQTLTTLLGKILRIDVRGDSGYAIPPDNPFAGSTAGAREEIWAYGLRNPWRFSFDSATGLLWAGDVGQGAREEIDLITRGANYGWKIMEGNICRPGGGGCDTTGLTLPLKDYDRGFGNSITGGYVYRGSRLPQFQGAYIYGDFGSGRIGLLRYEGGIVTADSLLLAGSMNISSFGVDERKELYVLDYTRGAVMKLQGPPVSVSADGPEQPAGFVLEQNYPNPFNPRTEVRSQMSEAGYVKLAVYDLLGREVRVLVNERRAAGSYRDEFEGSGLATGIYTYRMTVSLPDRQAGLPDRRAGSFVMSKQMILLK